MVPIGPGTATAALQARDRAGAARLRRARVTATASFVTPAQRRLPASASAPSSTTSGRPSRCSTARRDTLTVTGEDVHLVHEAAYHFLLSRIGEHLDRIGLDPAPRARPLGALRRRSPSCCPPEEARARSRSARSRTTMRAFSPRTRRSSTGTASCIPFPLRIGINATDAERLPAGSVRRIERMEFHPKLAIDLDAFRGPDRPVASPAPPHRRSASGRSAERRGSRRCRGGQPSGRCCARP